MKKKKDIYSKVKALKYLWRFLNHFCDNNVKKMIRRHPTIVGSVLKHSTHIFEKLKQPQSTFERLLYVGLDKQPTYRGYSRPAAVTGSIPGL